MKVLLETQKDEGKRMELAVEMVANLFEGTSAEEINDTLNRMLQVYIADAPFDRSELSNASAHVHALAKFLFNMELMYRTRPDNALSKMSVVLVEEQNECTHS